MKTVYCFKKWPDTRHVDVVSAAGVPAKHIILFYKSCVGGCMIFKCSSAQYLQLQLGKSSIAVEEISEQEYWDELQIAYL
jgi:hypothetical protein